MTGWALLETGWLLGTMVLPAVALGGGRWMRAWLLDDEPIEDQLEQGPPAPLWPHKLPLEPELAYIQQSNKKPDDKGSVYRPKHAAEPLDDTGEWPIIHMKGGVWLPKVRRLTATNVASGSTSPSSSPNGKLKLRIHRNT